MSLDNLVPTGESMLEFGEVYLRAIELSWRDPQFKADLLKDPMSALEHYFHYTSPWNFIFNVEEAKAGQDCRTDKQKENGHEPIICGWYPSTTLTDTDGCGGEWRLPLDKMSFGLPTAPPAYQQAVALALYNDAGPAYLFTCC